MSVPIPLNYVFLFNYFKHVLGSNKAMFFLVFPFLTAIGLYIEAPILYYVLIALLNFFVAIVPSGLGVLVV